MDPSRALRATGVAVHWPSSAAGRCVADLYRAPGGPLGTSRTDLACCIALGETIYAGTDDAHVVRLTADGRFDPLPGFEAVAGRERWYAGTALVDGRLVGPPLGIRSMAATSDHFAQGGAIYRRPIDGSGPLRPVTGGLPRWLDGIVDTGKIAARGSAIAVADRGGNLYLSADGTATWTKIASDIPTPSGLLIC
jgi:hypothetical protein